MNDLANQILAWTLGIALFLLFVVPAGIWLVRRIQHGKRRQLERSKRSIAVAAEPDAAPGECPHKRSKSRAKTGSDGQMTSICRFCGVAMLRNGPGDWEVIAEGGQASR
jgi:hypothetical protein